MSVSRVERETRFPRFRLDLIADVLPNDGKAQRTTIPFKPVQRNIVTDRAVPDEVCAAAV